MTKFTLKSVDKGWEALRKWSKQQKSYAKAGVLGDGKKDKRRGEAMTNVEIAMVHEFGAPKANIPERSFVRSSFEAHHGEYVLLLRRLLQQIMEKKTTIAPALNVIGAKMAADMKNGITAGVGIPPPLALSTVASKGSTRPLVDTGQLLNSITYVVVEGAD